MGLSRYVKHCPQTDVANWVKDLHEVNQITNETRIILCIFHGSIAQPVQIDSHGGFFSNGWSKRVYEKEGLNVSCICKKEYYISVVVQSGPS